MADRPARIAFVLQPVPEDADERTKQAAAIRNVCAVDGVCPDCGATGDLAGDRHVGVYHLTFAHSEGCRALYNLGGDPA